MNWLGFSAAVIQAIAWPAAILGLAIIFRAEVKGLMSDRMRRFKAGPLEVEWEHVAAQIEAQVPPAELGHEPGAESLLAELGDMAREHPAAAVLEAYGRVERRLRQMLEAHDEAQEGITLRSTTSAVGYARMAEQAGLVSPETVRAVEGLRMLRNLAAHGREGEVPPQRAVEYVVLAEAVLFALGDQPELQQ